MTHHRELGGGQRGELAAEQADVRRGVPGRGLGRGARRGAHLDAADAHGVIEADLRAGRRHSLSTTQSGHVYRHTRPNALFTVCRCISDFPSSAMRWQYTLRPCQAQQMNPDHLSLGLRLRRKQHELGLAHSTAQCSSYA